MWADYCEQVGKGSRRSGSSTENKWVHYRGQACQVARISG